MYVAEAQPQGEHWLDILTAIWIVSYTCRDMGTGKQVKKYCVTLMDKCACKQGDIRYIMILGTLR